MTDAPSVEVEESIVYTEVGRTSRVNIVCNFDAVPPVEVIWRHNQSRINFKERGRLTESHTHEGVYIMEIRSLLPEDLGEYECVGGNNQGQAIGVISIRGKFGVLSVDKSCTHTDTNTVTYLPSDIIIFCKFLHSVFSQLIQHTHTHMHIHMQLRDCHRQ